ncbi:MAG: hypothetical protein ACXWEH_04755 [Actinomycetota bacterium]
MLKRAFAVTAIAGLLLVACSGDGDADAPSGSAADPEAGSGAAGPSVAGDESLVDPMIAEGNGLGSCAFEFGVETLAERSFAFDGTVVEIRDPEAMDAPYDVDFEVSRWFHGGDGATVTVRTYDVSGTSLAGDLGLAAGDRVLAAGDDDFLWGCGFSMPYSPDAEALFEQAFGA